MSRLARWLAAALLVAGAALAATAGAQPASRPGTATASPSDVPVLPLTLPVLDLDTAVSSLDGSFTVQRTQLTLQSDVLFAFNRAQLAAGARPRIAEAVAEIRRRRPRVVQVVGFTDAKGSSVYNLGLSRRRAESVRTALAHSLGPGAPPLRAVGRGEANPIAANTTKDGGDDPRGRARNRRVEIRLR